MNAGKGVGNEVLQQTTITNTTSVSLGRVGGVKTPLTLILSRDSGQDPLREMLLVHRAAHHSTLHEVLTSP